MVHHPWYHFSNNSNITEGLVTFLDDSLPSLTELTLSGCSTGSEMAAQNLATVLQLNNRIQTLVPDDRGWMYLLSLFCGQFFQALQQKPNLQSLQMGQIHFTHSNIFSGLYLLATFSTHERPLYLLL